MTSPAWARFRLDYGPTALDQDVVQKKKTGLRRKDTENQIINTLLKLKAPHAYKPY